MNQREGKPFLNRYSITDILINSSDIKIAQTESLYFLKINLDLRKQNIKSQVNFSFQEIIIENRIRHAIYLYVHQSDQHLIESVKVKLQGAEVLVILEVIAHTGEVDRANVKHRLKKSRKFISKQVKEPIYLKVRVLPIEILEYEIDVSPNTEN